MADFLGALIGGALGMANSAINASYQSQQAAQDRRENYMYNEMAAGNADKRTRALYNDFYSPGALLQQYKEAGLSPSLMFGGTPGQGGMSGAQGAGSSGIQTHYAPISFMEGVQAANIQAQTEKLKAETKNIDKDTEVKEIERMISEMTKNLKTVEFDIATTILTNSDGTTKSIYEMATEAADYDTLLKELREIGSERFKEYAASEAGQKELRKIYLNAQRFETDINVLSNENVSAKFQKSVLNALNKEGFAEQNAETAIKQLRAAAEVADLTEQQKGAWNNLLEKLEKKNATAKDILIVAGMILSNYMHGSGIQVSTGDNYFVKNNQ